VIALILANKDSIWIESMHLAHSHSRAKNPHLKYGENPEIQGMMYRFCHYLKLPVTLVFVFDGDERPSIKRGGKVVAERPWIVDRLKELINGFGFYSHQVCLFLPVIMYSYV
jgi:Holliday junction resolvase YEN1